MIFKCEFSEPPVRRWFTEQEMNEKYPNETNEYLKRFNSSILNQDQCPIDKEYTALNKKKTHGILVAVYSCGTICYFDEMIRSESLNLIANQIFNIMKLNKKELNYVIYDSACHLHEFISKRSEYNELNNIKFYIDRFHLQNHVREKCHKDHNVDNNLKLKAINSQKAEQFFALNKRFKSITKNMDRIYFNLFYLIIFDELNSLN